jgi:hypothetical protein
MAFLPRRLPPINTGDYRADSGHLYSSYFFASGATVLREYDMFTTATGSIGQGYTGSLTETETNLLNANRNADQFSWVITDIGVMFNSDIILGDIQGFLNNASVVFRKPGYERNLGRTDFFAAGGGLWGVTTMNAAQSWTNGHPSPQSRRKLKREIIINPGETFKFSLKLANARASGGAALTLTNNCEARVDLYGYFAQEIVV